MYSIAVPAKRILAIELLFAFFDIKPKTIIPVISAPIKKHVSLLLFSIYCYPDA